MALRDNLTEPWGILAAGLVGGLGGAVTAAVAPVAVLGLPVGLGIAAVVYGVRVSLGALFDRPPAQPTAPASRQLPRPLRGSAADLWLRRAEAAWGSLRKQTESESDSVLKSQIADVDDRAVEVFTDLVRFGGQVTLIEEAAARINAAELHRERDSLRHALSAARPTDVHDEWERSLRSVDEQLAAHQRLIAAREGLLAKMQSTVLGMEGLVVRLAELSTMHAATDVAGDTAAQVRLLTDDLDGLRSGLAAAEAVSRQVLAGRPPQGG
ncbi:MAG: hypothetical protein H0T78_05175 [Longispora sp.]|nr:hypothetical protein [Longispora sp. (in: high G+C Gram-positive bacteria)]